MAINSRANALRPDSNDNGYNNLKREQDRKSKLGLDLISTGFEPEEEVDNDDYQNVGIGAEGYKKTASAIKKTSDISEGKENWLTKGGEGLTADTAMKSAASALNIGKSFTEVSGSQSESWAQTGKQALELGQLGMQIGGPLGAGIGAVVGGAAGIIDMYGDQDKRNAADRKAANDKHETMDTKRELQYSMDSKQSDLNKQIALRKAQLNYINPKY